MMKLFASLLAVSILVSGAASAAIYEPEKGETLQEFQSSEHPYIDRREIRVSQGSQALDLTKWDRLRHQDRIALHFVNDTASAVNITLPQIPANFVVPANSDRTYEFVASEVGDVTSLSYEVSSLEGPAASYLAQSQALMDIINAKIVIPTFAEEKQLTYVRPTSDYKPATKMVRGYW
ncbi:MAG: hypothetical protein U0003_03365 [Vampirovibrionales bacterium]